MSGLPASLLRLVIKHRALLIVPLALLLFVFIGLLIGTHGGILKLHYDF